MQCCNFAPASRKIFSGLHRSYCFRDRLRGAAAGHQAEITPDLLIIPLHHFPWILQSPHRIVIMNGFEKWQQVTCIKFIQRDLRAPGDEPVAVCQAMSRLE
jgi:hypothetical protein